VLLNQKGFNFHFIKSCLFTSQVYSHVSILNNFISLMFFFLSFYFIYTNQSHHNFPKGSTFLTSSFKNANIYIISSDLGSTYIRLLTNILFVKRILCWCLSILLCMICKGLTCSLCVFLTCHSCIVV
jgi:hypothetical protein